jgi:hypothetical protein
MPVVSGGESILQFIEALVVTCDLHLCVLQRFWISFSHQPFQGLARRAFRSHQCLGPWLYSEPVLQLFGLLLTQHPIQLLLQLIATLHKLDQMVTAEYWRHFVVHIYTIECASRTWSTCLFWERTAYLGIANLPASFSKAFDGVRAAYREEKACQRLHVVLAALV